jgi:hypothetical protein
MSIIMENTSTLMWLNLCLGLFVLGLEVGKYLYKPTPVVQKTIKGLKVYKTKTGTALQCIQGGKSKSFQSTPDQELLREVHGWDD